MAQHLSADSEAPAAPPASSPAPPAAASQLSRGVRETIESIAIALALAFLFKTFEAEAFVIPTGSMAPTLMGRHKDVTCPSCGYAYTASGSDEADRDGYEKNDPQSQVVSCTCPICRFPMSVDPLDEHNRGRDAQPSYSGDRIWVSKVPYHLMEPRRFDVLVFRFPEEADTYYIKRLVGLPQETVKIRHGDIFVKKPDEPDFTIVRKPPEKLRAMAQVVHDNDYVSPPLDRAGWPLRWQPWSRQDTPGDWEPSEDTRSYRTDGTGSGESWMRYQHIVPTEDDWRDANGPQPANARAQLITDYYAFNTRVLRREPGSMPSTLGLHWVGDLILDFTLKVESSTGSALLDLVKGGRHFRCEIDLATGEATLKIDGLPQWQRTASTSVRGPGSYKIMFANVDQELLLWIDDSLVSFDKPTTYPDLGNERPMATERDRGDLAPVGIGSRGAALSVEHLRVLRDIYYIADRDSRAGLITDYSLSNSRLPHLSHHELVRFLSDPAEWDTPREGNAFDRRQEVVFDLGPDQFFVLGDNSPASSDARLWPSQQFVERDLLVGKALLVYWPHPLRLYVPFTDVSLGVIPNFYKMGLIR